MNRMLENYFRCYCNFQKNNWDEPLPVSEFSYNSAVSADLGSSPFELYLGWNAKYPLELLSTPESTVERVHNFKVRMKSALFDAKYAHIGYKDRQSAYSGQKYTPACYKIVNKDRLKNTLFKDSVTNAQKSSKQSARRFGPFSTY